MKTLKIILSLVGIFIALYLVFAFIGLQIDFTKWTSATRFVFVCLLAIFYLRALQVLQILTL
jgi:hypothetical protein